MDTKDTVVYLNLKFCYMTALALQAFLEEKDPILVNGVYRC